VIAVDTHVHRVVNRWGIMKECVNKSSTTSWSPSFLKEDKMECGKKSEDKTECGKFGMVNGTKTPEETSEILEKIVPLKYKDFAHHAIVLF
jgi:endonuclease III